MFYRSNFNVSHPNYQSQNSIESIPSLAHSTSSDLSSKLRGNFQKPLHSTSTSSTEYSSLRGTRFKFPWQKDKKKPGGGVNLIGLKSDGTLGGEIKPNTETWVVSHGWNSKGKTIRDDRTMINLARAIDGFSNNDQVIVLDWKTLATSGKANPREAASKIKDVGAEAARLLKNAGIDGAQLNLAGHSMGGYVVNEIAKRFGGVDKLIALDPASPLINTGNPFKSSYPVDTVNYDAVSKYAWGFYGSTLGYDKTTKTANESFEFYFTKEDGSPRLDLHANHKDVVTAFTHVLERNNRGAGNQWDELFSLNQMHRDSRKPWANTNRAWDKGLLPFGEGFDAGVFYKQQSDNWKLNLILTQQ